MPRIREHQIGGMCCLDLMQVEKLRRQFVHTSADRGFVSRPF
jgi:hypothetical protein